MVRSVVVSVALATAVGGIAAVGAADARASANPNCPTIIGPSGQLSAHPSPGTNWSGCDLQGADLYEAQLSNVNLSGANLQGAALMDTTGKVVNFAGANLSGADLNYAQLQYANLTGASLQSAIGGYMTLTDSDLTGDDISNANFVNVTLTNIKSGNLITSGGAPTLPTGWTLDNGYLMGQVVDFSGDDFPALGSNVPDLASRDLSGSQFGGANMTGVDLSNDDLAGTSFEVANLTNAKFAGDNLTGTDFSTANLTGANLHGATLTGALWDNATCPDGTLAASHSETCANDVDLAPVAHPVVNGSSVNGWYREATVTWNWSDANGTIDPAHCPSTTTNTTQGKSVDLSATCENTAGEATRASVPVNIDNTAPTVALTGVTAGKLYTVGHVPAAACRTADALSGVATPAKLTITTSGSHGVGSFTAACSGAVNQAGIGQAAPVRVSYAIAYGLSGFLTPEDKATVARSARTVTVTFRLAGITAPLAAKLGAAGRLRVTLSGPGVAALTAAAAWQPKSGTFTVRLRIPGNVKIGRNYLVTVRENVGTGPIVAPALARAVNPEVIQFR